MKIIFDMDNTLTDETGATVRPDIVVLLRELKKDGHILVLWTSSTRDRARHILRDQGLRRFFTNFIYRENYDPEMQGRRKDLTLIRGDFIIDDDPDEIEFNQKKGINGFLISTYRRNFIPPREELNRLRKEIRSTMSFGERLKRFSSGKGF